MQLNFDHILNAKKLAAELKGFYYLCSAQKNEL